MQDRLSLQQRQRLQLVNLYVLCMSLQLVFLANVDKASWISGYAYTPDSCLVSRNVQSSGRWIHHGGRSTTRTPLERNVDECAASHGWPDCGHGEEAFVGFSKHGCIYYRADLEQKSQSFAPLDETSIEVDSTLSLAKCDRLNRFALGLLNDSKFWEGKRSMMGLDRGLCMFPAAVFLYSLLTQSRE